MANGTAGQFDQALAVQQHQYHVPAYPGHGGRRGLPAQTVHGTPQSPQLPASLAHAVLAILGLTNYQSFVSNAVHADQKILDPQSSTTSQCVAETGLPKACNTPADFAANYNLNGLYRRGALGQGQTVAIVTLAALDTGAPQFFWKNILGVKPSGRTVTVTNVDGGPGAPSDASGTGETDLDAEQSGALAPDANVIVYQAPNTDPGFFDGFADAASQNIADSVSTSWGESEVVIKEAVASGSETPAYVAAFDEMYLEMAAQGQSAFDASGDEAAYDDYDELGTTPLAVDNPADSPYITASGGTTLPFTGTVSGPAGTASISSGHAERTWGWDYTWAGGRSGRRRIASDHRRGFVPRCHRQRRRFQLVRVATVLSAGCAGNHLVHGRAVLHVHRCPGHRQRRVRADGVRLRPQPADHPGLRFGPRGARCLHRRRPDERIPPL